MKHLGDITKINGAEAPPVNVIIGGSPCQDLSIAGKREGLKGERSGLFMEQIRIIKEMRAEDIRCGRKATDIRPRYMVWENVPGAFSSHKGADFKAVLEETVGIVEEVKPDIPIPKGGWHYSGIIVGDGYSIAWRVFDAQFWGVPQRRRRIALVADFGGQSAPEILFERKGVSRYTPPRTTPWKDFAAALAERFGGADQSGRAKNASDATYCIQGNAIDRADTAGCNGRGWTEGVSYTLNTVDRPAIYAVDQGGGKSSANVSVNKAATLTCTHGGEPVIFDARGNGDGKTAPTLTGDHENRVTDYTSLCVRERCGCEGGGKSVLVQDNKSATIRAANDQFVIAIDRAAFNQGENALYDPKFSEDGINSTLTAKGPSAVCAGFSSRAGSKSGSIAYQNEVAPTLRSGLLDTSVVLPNCAVRRLTPLECERLQGFPDGWTVIGDYVDTDGKKRKTSDTARYKTLGNSIALPSWVWVLERLSYCCGADRTMASLFDGIGGFPLIWETLNGKGACVWASEIEEFPIAVTKFHFKE